MINTRSDTASTDDQENPFVKRTGNFSTSSMMPEPDGNDGEDLEIQTRQSLRSDKRVAIEKPSILKLNLTSPRFGMIPLF